MADLGESRPSSHAWMQASIAADRANASSHLDRLHAFGEERHPRRQSLLRGGAVFDFVEVKGSEVVQPAINLTV